MKIVEECMEHLCLTLYVSLPYILNGLMGTVVMNLHYINKTELAFRQEEEERDEMLAEARDGKKSCEISADQQIMTETQI